MSILSWIKGKLKRRRVRYTIDFSPALNAELYFLAEEDGVTKAEIIRRALSLYNITRKAVRQGKRVGADPDPSKFETIFVGL